MQLKNEVMLRRKVPAAFAEEPAYDKVSKHYSFLPTTDVLHILQDEGWEAWSARQVACRTWSDEHAKHLIRLRHGDLTPRKTGLRDSFPEMLLINAHNGCGSYTLQGGIFRMICSNGMVVSESDFGRIHLRHMGFEPEQVINASRKLVHSASDIALKIDTWKSVDLDKAQRRDFYGEAARIRFGDDTTDQLVDAIATPRRMEDADNDLWSVFNVAQENVIRGDFRNETTNRMVRKITHIQTDVKYNTELWDLANGYMELIDNGWI